MGLETATYISELVTSNPVASDNKSQGDDHLRLIKAALQATFPGADLPFYISTDRTDVASAATTDIGAVTSQYVNITGTTTITSFGTANAGVWRWIRFNAALTLTHNGTSLILPTAANITTVAGDHALAVSRGSGNWQVVYYARASGDAILAFSTSFAAVQASQAEIAAETDVTKFIAPDQTKYAPGAAKAWAHITEAGSTYTVQAGGENISSVTRVSEGIIDVNFTTAFASANYAAIVTPFGNNNRIITVLSQGVSSCRVQVQAADASLTDDGFNIAIFGTF